MIMIDDVINQLHVEEERNREEEKNSQGWMQHFDDPELAKCLSDGVFGPKEPQKTRRKCPSGGS